MIILFFMESAVILYILLAFFNALRDELTKGEDNDNEH